MIEFRLPPTKIISILLAVSASVPWPKRKNDGRAHFTIHLKTNRMTRWQYWLAITLIVAGAAPSPAQSLAKVQVAYDFLESFQQGRVSQASECAVRRPATVGGVRQHGLFEHPRGVEPPVKPNADGMYQLPVPGKTITV